MRTTLPGKLPTALRMMRPGVMPGASALLHLFTYEYSRPWPAELDYRLALGIFSALAVLPCVLLAFLRGSARRWLLGARCEQAAEQR